MQFRFFGASIQLRVVYALIASLLWWATVENADVLKLEQHAQWITGAVYSALVLIPYLPGLNGALKLRALALLFLGALSYWAAITFWLQLLELEIFGDMSELPRTISSLGIAGVLGAVIIGIAARLFIPLKLRWSGWLVLVGAGLLGGMALGTGLEAGMGVLGNIRHEYWLPGHIAWQVLVCLALYYGSKASARDR